MKTFEELGRWIDTLTDEQVRQDVTVYDMCSDTYIPITGLGVMDDDVVQNQPVLIFNDNKKEN